MPLNLLYIPASAKPVVQRFKGLGEMDAEDLRDTTMHIENRVLRKITVEDAMLADQIFTDLMGDDVTPRKKYIEEHGSEFDDLDV